VRKVEKLYMTSIVVGWEGLDAKDYKERHLMEGYDGERVASSSVADAGKPDRR
jgi:hypothetical protein